MGIKIDNLIIVKRAFFDRNPEIVAEELLGKYLVRILGTDILSGIIVETEAYLPFNDPAAHSFAGKNERNKSTFGPPGHAYVHKLRHHYLLDIVTLGVDIPGSVLVRSLEPVGGIETMKKNRKTDNLFGLTSGPSKICQAFGVDIAFDGVDLTDSGNSLFVASNKERAENISVNKSKRIGITKASDLMLRFCVTNNPFVSR